MSPTAIGASKHAYFSLLCHNVPSIISKESIYKHNFGQTLKLQIGYSEYKVKVIKIYSTLFCLQTNYVYLCKFGTEEKRLVQKTNSEKA